MKSSEFRRWLAKQGVIFGTQTGAHLKLYFNGKQSFLPTHGKDLPRSLVQDIKKQLGLKDKE